MVKDCGQIPNCTFLFLFVAFVFFLVTLSNLRSPFFMVFDEDPSAGFARHDLDGLKMMDSSTLNNPFWWCLRGTFIANPCKHTFCRNGRAPAIGCWARTASTFQPPSASLLGQKIVHFPGVQGMKIGELWPKPLLFCFVHWDYTSNLWRG